MKTTIHRTKLQLAMGLLGAALADAPHAQEITVEFDIPEQPASSALITFGEQAGITVLVNHAARDVQLPELKGAYKVDEAIKLLLKDAKLTYKFDNEGIIVSPALAGKDKKKKGTLFSAMVGVLAAAFTSGAVVADEDNSVTSEQYQIDEIVVTATRRETSLQDTAISMAAIGGEDINRRNLSEMNDYLRTLPGVNLVDVGVGYKAVVIRGLGVDPEAEGTISGPTTGVYFGEVSLAGLGVAGGSTDLKMIDLERVEVLRGPQGTLFGSGSLGGTVRNIPNGPNLNEFEGNIKVNYSNTAKSGGDNTKYEGVINIPIIDDKLGIRAVAYKHDASGYIDNIAGTILDNDGNIFPNVPASLAIAVFGGPELYENEDDIGHSEYTGGRISALWQPTDSLSVNLQYAYQEAEQLGEPYVELGLGDYEQVTLQLGDGQAVAGREIGHTDEINLTDLVVEYDIGWASLLSSSAWLDETSEKVQDQSAYGGYSAVQIVDFESEAFEQELRITSNMEGRLQFVVGLYYEDIKRPAVSGTVGLTDEITAVFGNPFGVGNRFINKTFLFNGTKQTSFYGEITYDINDNFNLALGARRFDYEREAGQTSIGALYPSVPVRNVKENGTNYKANLSYTPDESTLIYAQWAEGFRLGTVRTPIDTDSCDVNNDGLLDGTNAKIGQDIDSDTTENLELGAKITLLDNRMQVNAAIYRIDWQGIPVLVFPGALPGQPQTCFSSMRVNVGEARSQGIEIEFTYLAFSGLRINAGAAYINAELTKDAPGINGESGDRLPSSPEYSFNLGVQYDFSIAGYEAYVQGNYALVGGFYNRVGEQGVELGDYDQLGMSAGVSVNKFRFELFGDNLTNENALTHGSTAVPDERAYRLRPRTIGFNIGYQF